MLRDDFRPDFLRYFSPFSASLLSVQEAGALNINGLRWVGFARRLLSIGDMKYETPPRKMATSNA